MGANVYADTPQGLTLHVTERQGCPLHVWTGGPAGGLLVALLDFLRQRVPDRPPDVGCP